MKNSNRDLLVLIKDDTLSDQAIERQVKWLNEMLIEVERSEQCYQAYEIVDLNNSKRSRNAFKIRMMMRAKDEKPFLFLSSLN